MKKYLPLTFLFLACCLSSHAVITIASGTTSTMGSINIADDIVIETGGTLIINGNLMIGLPGGTTLHTITVKEGGKLTSNGGGIEPYPGTKWGGIKVHSMYQSAGQWTAVDLNNFTIKDVDDVALEELGEPFNHYLPDDQLMYSGIRVRNSTFDQNKRHFDCINGKAQNPNWQHLGLNSILFENVHFGNTYGTWPIHIGYVDHVTFDKCTFDMLSYLELHLRSITDLDITENTFFANSKASIAMHANPNWPFDDVLIDNNQFLIINTNHDYYSIGIGCETMSGYATNTTISNNKFYGITSKKCTGVCSGNNYNAGWSTNLKVLNNEFVNFQYPFTSMEASGLVKENTMTGYKTAVKIEGDNSSLLLYCNTFNSGDLGIDIITGSLHDLNAGGDHANMWVGSTGDIINNTLNGLDVFVHPGNPHPPVNIAGIVTLTNTMQWAACYLTEEENHDYPTRLHVADQEAFPAVYPNPAKDQLFITVEGDEALTATLHNILGKTVAQPVRFSGAGAHSIDVSGLAPGTYLLLIQQGQEHRTEKVVIK